MKKNLITLAVLTLVTVVVLNACSPIQPSGKEGTTATLVRTQAVKVTASPTTHTEPTDTPTPTSALNINKTNLYGQTIIFWHVQDGEQGKLIQSLAEEFTTSNEWGIIVLPRFQGTYDDIDLNLSEVEGDTEKPDIVTGYLHQAQVWDAKIGLADLDNYITDPNWGISEDEHTAFYPVYWTYDFAENKRLGVPFQGNAQMLYYNKTWANALGFENPPQTPEELKEQACKAAQANRNDDNSNNDQTGGLILDQDYATVLSWINAFGGDILLENEKDSTESIYQFTSPEILKSFFFLRDLYDQGCAFFPSDLTPAEAFANREGLFMTDSALGISYQIKSFRNAANPDYWTVLPFPSSKEQPVIDTYAPALEILKSNPEKQLAAWLFVKWMLQPQNQARLIEDSSALPIRSDTQEFLQKYEKNHPQWAAAVELIPYGKPEPQDISWGTVRWALSDAFSQLYMYYFTIDQIPDLLNFLDQTAYEIYVGPRKSGVYDTPTFTPTLTYTPSITPSPTITPTVTKTPRFTYTSTP